MYNGPKQSHDDRGKKIRTCLIGIYTLLQQCVSIKKLYFLLSHGVCQLGMQPNQTDVSTSDDDGGIPKNK